MGWFMYALGGLFVWRVYGLVKPPWALRLVIALMWPVMVGPLWDLVNWIRQDLPAQHPRQ